MDFILDTDHVTLLQQRSQPEYDRFQANLRKYPGAVLRTVISFQEHSQEWLAFINKPVPRNTFSVATRN